tara:strand:- start:12 stop:302 length:291 start_codon:yes stop_codon:yes gene_type:complete
MINDYEFLEHDEYINEIDTISMDKTEYNNIIKTLLKKNNYLENENKKNKANIVNINNKYLNTVKDFNCLNKNYLQLEKDLYDMECVNIELLKIIKN